jgi:hypothetical protein
VAGSDRAKFYVLARGTALLEIEREPVRTLSAGDIALVAHGTPHVLRDAPRTPLVPVCDAPHQRSAPSHQVRRVGGDGPRTSRWQPRRAPRSSSPCPAPRSRRVIAERRGAQPRSTRLA